MTEPLVSVVMTSFNYERFIRDAIESVLDQTEPDLELIIIDDASSDSSREIIRGYQKKDDRIRTLFHPENRGIARSVNDGIGMAGGRFIASIASDDLWMADKLEKQVRVLSTDEDLVVWSEGLVIDAAGTPTGKTFTQIVPDAQKSRKSGDLFTDLLAGNYIFGSTRIVKRENLGGIRFNERLRYLNDHQFAVDLAHKYHYYFIDEPLACYRVHGQNTQTRDPAAFIIELREVYGYFLRRYGKDIPPLKRYELRVRYNWQKVREYQARRSPGPVEGK
jgi:glycosyltransferase involved in cell wall biosynthesis